MKSTLLLSLLTLALASSIRAQDAKSAADKPAAAKPAPANPAPAAPDPALMDKVSYFIGTDIGQNLARSDIKLNMELFTQAINDAIAKKQPKYSEAELRTAMEQFQTVMQAKQQAEQTKQQAEMVKAQAELATSGPKNAEEGTKFLAENGKREGVTTTASGLQYEVIKKADGAKPASTDTVTVHYRGTLLDGKEFDSSYSRNEPASFPLNQVISGWTEGVQLMNVGSKYKFFIPSKLAYGESGSPPRIGPNSTLVFEVELISIDK